MTYYDYIPWVLGAILIVLAVAVCVAAWFAE